MIFVNKSNVLFEFLEFLSRFIIGLGKENKYKSLTVYTKQDSLLHVVQAR